MANVISYLRCSTKKQQLGDTERRQVELGERWIKKHGHTLVETYADLGVSSFRGRNRHSGALSSILAKIKEGEIAAGTILLVEACDRLSRQEMDEAHTLFSSIIRAGVNIAVLTPAERVYDKDTLKSPFTLLEPLLAFYLANVESEKKAQRIKEVWNAKRRAGGKYNVKTPSWISRVDYKKTNTNTDNTAERKRHDPHAEKFKLNSGAEAIRYIFNRTADGVGQRRLLGELVAKFKPIGSSGSWNTSFISKVLNDRSVLGEYAPRVRGDDGKRVAVGSVIVDYWPPVISEELWLRVQAAKAKRKKMKGANTKFVNPFVGLMFNAHDGSAVHTQQSRGRERRLVSYAHLRHLPNACSLSVPYDRFSETCLAYLGGLRVEDVEQRVDVSALRAKEQEVSGIRQRIAEIEHAMASPDEDFTTLRNALRSARETEKRLLTELAELQVDVSSTTSPLRQLKEMTDEERLANTERLRLLVHELVARIELRPEKHYGRVWCVCLVMFRNGTQRLFAFSSQPMSYQENFAMMMPVNASMPSVKKWKNPNHYILADIAKRHSQPADVVSVKDVPHNIGDAAKLFLNVRRGEMSAASFRVVPSKIERFVDHLGDDLPCANVNQSRWDRWMAWIENEVKEQRLASGTARITWQRAREFVRWLHSHKACSLVL